MAGQAAAAGPGGSALRIVDRRETHRSFQLWRCTAAARLPLLAQACLESHLKHASDVISRIGPQDINAGMVCLRKGGVAWSPCCHLAPIEHCLAHSFKDADVVCDGRAAHIEHSHQFRAGYLDASRCACELHRCQHVHGNAGRSYWMTLGL